VRLLIFGKQGAGKGTQATRLAVRYGIPHISTGDMFRAAVRAGTAFGRKAKEYMDAGELVPDEVVLGMVQERLAEPDAATGFLLDGFPRTKAQAEGLAEVVGPDGLDAVVELTVPTDVVVERISNRRVCQRCGATYDVGSPPAGGWDACDTCGGGPIVQRDDDREEAVRRRLDLYEQETAPLAGWYAEQGLLVPVDGVGSPDEVFERILAGLAVRPGLDGHRR
jgi:adenylate kinase